MNANVFYGLGHRHRARETGTMIVRQVNAPIPFDINSIKAFPYEYEPEDHAIESVALITRVLQQSLEQNRPDTPVQAALSVQRQHHEKVETLLMEAENAIRNSDPATALLRYRDAATISFANPLIRLKLGLLHKDTGNCQLVGGTRRVQRGGAIVLLRAWLHYLTTGIPAPLTSSGG